MDFFRVSVILWSKQVDDPQFRHTCQRSTYDKAQLGIGKYIREKTDQGSISPINLMELCTLHKIHGLENIRSWQLWIPIISRYQKARSTAHGQLMGQSQFSDQRWSRLDSLVMDWGLFQASHNEDCSEVWYLDILEPLWEKEAKAVRSRGWKDRGEVRPKGTLRTLKPSLSIQATASQRSAAS